MEKAGRLMRAWIAKNNTLCWLIGPFLCGLFAPQGLNGAEIRKIINLDPGAALHMREAPDRKSRVLAYIPESIGEVTLTGPCDDKWCPITFRGMNGYAFRRFLDPTFGADAAPPDAEATKGSTTTTAFPGAAVLAPSGLTGGSPGGERGPLYAIEGAPAGEPLTIREAPDDQAAVKGVIPANGSRVEGLKQCAGKWCLVRHDGMTGWVLRRHLASSDGIRPLLRIVNMSLAAVLALKEHPASDAADVGAIPSYATGVVQIGACDKTWCHVRYLGAVGWVDSRFIAAEPKL